MKDDETCTHGVTLDTACPQCAEHPMNSPAPRRKQSRMGRRLNSEFEAETLVRRLNLAGVNFLEGWHPDCCIHKELDGKRYRWLAERCVMDDGVTKAIHLVWRFVQDGVPTVVGNGVILYRTPKQLLESANIVLWVELIPDACLEVGRPQDYEKLRLQPASYRMLAHNA